MPKLQSQNAQARAADPYPSLLVLQHDQRKVVVKLPTAQLDDIVLYQSLQEEAFKTFDVGTDQSDITFWTSELPGFEDEEVEVSPSALPGLVANVRRLIVKGPLDDEDSEWSDQECSKIHISRHYPADRPLLRQGTMCVEVSLPPKVSRPSVMFVECKPALRVGRLRKFASSHCGKDPRKTRIRFNGSLMRDKDKLSVYGVEDSDQLTLEIHEVGGKAVLQGD
ncbi:hypothetical protein DFP72DRAFT_578628 [Ephemerocybe angulata]|uniref:Ubiquitin-like domain-containing protein n=1 Tax=Ephemerocybe angulata TaxID=980116 RepID=A0A8H6HKP9_9AGAR|nr:hypothetical protein DFP72DRAFT_578628 [Tulosesus angulatus]